MKCINTNTIYDRNDQLQQQQNSNSNRLSRAPRRGSMSRQNPAVSSVNAGRLARSSAALGTQTRGQGRRKPEGSVPTKCFLEIDYGRCFGNFPRYFYNVTSHKCESFSFGGCGGNANNFNNQKTCQDVCITMGAGSSVSSGGLARRPDGAINGGFFDMSSSNMGTGSSLFKPSVEDNMGSNMGMDERFAMNTNTDTSKTNNHIASKTSQTAPQRCLQELSQGTCRGKLTRFYYNQQTHRCESFIYHGCQGNQNNFFTFEECQRTCGYYSDIYARQRANVNQRRKQSQSQPSQQSPKHLSSKGDGLTAPSGWSVGIPPQPQAFCMQNPQQGPCTGRQIRWFYHRLNKRCERFAFSGCGGNQNNFQNVQECNRACVSYHDENSDLNSASPSMQTRINPTLMTGAPTPPDLTQNLNQPNIPRATSEATRPQFCSLPAKSGRCRANLKRYFFNTTSGTCDEFRYGGCGPNENNFMSIAACHEICQSPHAQNNGGVFTSNDKSFFDFPTKDKGMGVLDDVSQQLSNPDMLSLQDKQLLGSVSDQEAIPLLNSGPLFTTRDLMRNQNQGMSTLDMWAAMH